MIKKVRFEEEREPRAPKAAPGYLGDAFGGEDLAQSAAALPPSEVADSAGRHNDLRTQAADEAVNRAMDELDKSSESLMVLRTNCGDSSLSKSEALSFPATKVKAAAARTPSELRIWVFGDFCAEMITALSELGVAPRNIRSWNNLRSAGPRPPLLAMESPDWLFINMPQAMKERHPNV